jgi:hypothetical protein
MRSKTVVALTSALAAFVALTVVSVAWGTHARPGSGTPDRLPLVHSYKQCTAPNSTHVLPLALASCTPPPGLESDIVTSGNAGAFTGFTKLKVFCVAPETTPPCTPGDGQEEQDIQVTAQGRDVRCKIGPLPGCSAPGADYTGTLIGTSRIRITDHSNGGLACANNTGAPPCVTATTIDTDFSITAPCADNGGANGANCGVTTTINAEVPGAVKERQGGIVSTFTYKVLDAGPDGTVGPGCPPICGTADEKTAAIQGLFLP